MTDRPNINWQEKYLQQIETRLAELFLGQRNLDAKIDRLEGRMDRMDGSIDRLDEKIDAGLREVRRLQWGTMALVAAAVVGAAVRNLI